MQASASQVKALRDRTGAGMMDCKGALEETGGDLEKAVDFLRKKGMASTAKRAGHEAREGLVAIRSHAHTAAMVEANCETDFVARTDDFRGLATLALDEVLERGEDAVNSEKVSARVAELSGKIGERIIVRRAKVVETEGALFSYLHSNSKLGVIIELGVTKPESKKSPALAELGKNLAMQVAASSPLCVDRALVPAAVLEREKAIYAEEIKGKPEAIIQKILQGKLEKFYQGACLLEQPFISDDKKAVREVIAAAEKQLGDRIQVRQFVRFQLGEVV